MTGFDVTWDKQESIMTVQFRPDKKPKNKAEWFDMLGNYAHTLAKLINWEDKK